MKYTLVLLTFIIGALLPSVSSAQQGLYPQNVRQKYKDPQVFRVYKRIGWKEKALNSIGLTNDAVGRSYALVAGVSDYNGARDLPPVEKDISRLVTYLRDVELFDEVVVLKNEDMTVENLRYFLRTYFPQQLRSSPRSRFLFAYSGHGNDEEGEGYLLDNGARTLTDFEHSIDMAEVKNWIDESIEDAYHSLILINACKSGAFLRTAQGGDSAIPSEPGAHAITASGSDELAWARGEGGSVFFEKFFDGVQEGRADIFPSGGDGVIQVNELYTYLKQEVNLAEQGQNPQLGDLLSTGSNGGFFFLHRNKNVTGQVKQDLGPLISTGGNETQSLDVESLVVVSSNQKATVRIDGRHRGDLSAHTPLRITVNPGEHIIEIVSEQDTRRETVRVERGMSRVVNAVFSAQVSTAQADWRSWPREIERSGIEFVLIEPGKFDMGSDSELVLDSEKPVHRVELTKAFYLGKMEVTQGQWETVMGTTVKQQRDKHRPDYPVQGEGPNYPMYYVSWVDIQEFIRRLNQQKNCGNCYRLPTEAEWEYAARAGTQTAYSFGNNEGDLDAYVWYASNSGDGTHPVGRKQANPWGLHDIHGNVGEWVSDIYGQYENGTVIDPLGPDTGSDRVVRGGSWYFSARILRSSFRGTLPPGDVNGGVGFRLLRTYP